MSLPTLQQYSEALQNPQRTLTDPILKNGQVKLTGLRLPLALCGGFALTYNITVGSKKYAIRCFHKKSNELEARYRAISNKLKSVNSPYFVQFEYQPKGIYLNNDYYPVVKMDWASGVTLGEFLESNYKNKLALINLRSSSSALASFLESQRIAHGDIQPGNVMVSNEGHSLQLIDYDGMYVDSINNLGSSELGLRNFQHPGRSSSSWDYNLDRFPFIALNIALRALELKPSLWASSQSDSETFLFTANDYLDPDQSAIFAELMKIPQIIEYSKNFASICKSSFSKIPSLVDFLDKKNIPLAIFNVKPTISFEKTQYISSFPILDASNYYRCLPQVGNRVELIGKITDVKIGRAINDKPYIFINFGFWRGEIVKLAIWSDCLLTFNKIPDKSWVDKWVSVVGLLDPPYTSPKNIYTHLSINITQETQIHFISQTEAHRRLSGKWVQSSIQDSKLSSIPSPTKESITNEERLEQTKRLLEAARLRDQALAAKTNGVNKNQQVLQNMKSSLSNSQTQPTKQTASPSYQPPKSSPVNIPQQPVKNKSLFDYCFIATALYGQDAKETNILRYYRDHTLLNSWFGRVLVGGYYKISPHFVPLLKRNKIINLFVRSLINRIVTSIQRINKSTS